jgi:uncharacterized protein YndB with AHSA1/START domain
MKTLHFASRIDAPPQTVWNTMLGADTYTKWTADFCEGSYYEGSWEKGQRIRFVAPNQEGLSSIIDENRPHEFISIRHIGMVKNGVEDTTSEQVKRWAPSFENYTFVPVDGGTELRVDLDVEPETEKYMQDTWPKSLERLKQLCENR